VAKYGVDWGGWRSGAISGSHGVGLWKFICMGWQNFRRFCKFDVGEGSKIRFWDDIWCGERALKEEFPSLFSIARFKEASIANNMEPSNISIQWNIQFTRLLHDWEVGELASFYKGGCLLARVSLRSSPSIERYRLVGWSLFLGRVFGSPKPLLEWLSLFGRRFIARSLL
jgi:hypothetical protein